MGPSRPVKAILFDLDGTVLDTETLVLEVVRCVAESHGAVLTAEAAELALGMRPLDAWAAVAEALGIERSAQELFDQSEPLLRDRWHEAPLLPGVARLVAHLQAVGVRMALATSTSRATLGRKLASKAEMREAFAEACCGDEVVNGKPAPDCFVHLAERMGIDPADCLVIEDAPAGVAAATAAGMRVVAVPSMLQKGGKPSAQYPAPTAGAAAGCVALLPSLLEFRPEEYGLPPFQDRISETIPLHPLIYIRGTVVKGFGRGSRELGIPTANVDADSLRTALAEAVTGIFGGWCSVGDSPAVYKTALSIGWNPVYGNAEKTCEPWILHDFGEGADFCGSDIRLVICAYIRPEANFDSLQALIDRIHRDAQVAEEALEDERYRHHAKDPFLLPPAQQAATVQPAEGGPAKAVDGSA